MPNRYQSKYSTRSPDMSCGQAGASVNGCAIFSAAGRKTTAPSRPLICGCAVSRRGSKRTRHVDEGMAVAVLAVVVLALFAGWLVAWLVVPW